MHAEAFQRSGYDEEGIARPLVFAIGLHLLLAVVLWLSTWMKWDHSMSAAAGSTIDATMETTSAEDRAVQRALRVEPAPLPEPVKEVVEEETAPPPQPIPEPAPQEAPTPRQVQAQERIPVPDTVDQDEARADAISQEKARKEQEAKRRQEQLDLTEERNKQEEAEQKRRLAAQQAEAERQKKLDEIRRQRAELEKQKSLAEQKLRQLADARASQQVASAATSAPAAQARGAGGDVNDTGEWLAAVAAAIERQWIRPDSVSPGVVCPIRIRILPGGEVMSAEVQPSCPYDEKARDSVERAVMKASPLPYSGYNVPGRDIVVRFQASR